MKIFNIYTYIFGLVCSLHVLILSKLIYYPYPELFIYPYLTNKGLLPYGQILDQHFPGLMFLPINLNNLGMLNELDARVWSIGIVILVQLLLYLIGQKLLKSKILALLVCLLYLMWQPFFEGWVLWIDSFLPILLLPAFYFTVRGLENGKARDVILSGLFLGLAIVFKQVILPLAMIVGLVFLFRYPKVRTVLIYGGAVSLLPLMMVGYFWSIGVFGDFWYWTVVFNLTTFAETGKKPPFFSGLVRLLGVYLPVLGLFFVRSRLAVVLGVFIIGSLVAIYARFDFVHLQPSLPFVCLATVLVLVRLRQTRGLRFLAAGYLMVAVVWLSVFYRGHIGQQVLFFDENTKMVARLVTEMTEPNEEIFLWGVSPHIYSMSETIPAGRIFVFQFPWFLEISGQRILNGLTNSSARLILRDRSVTMEGMKMSEFSPEIDGYINSNYDLVKTVGEIEFLRRKNEN